MRVCVCVAELGGELWGTKEVRGVLDKKYLLSYCSTFLRSYFSTSPYPIQHPKLIFNPFPSLHRPISRDTTHIPTHSECNVKHNNSHIYGAFFFMCYFHVYYSI